MEDRKRGRNDEEGGDGDAAGEGDGAPPVPSFSSSSSSSAAAAAAPAATSAGPDAAPGPGAPALGADGPEAPALRPRPPPPPFHGAAADSALGERCIDALLIVSASGYAAEVSQCRWLCGEKWRAGDRGATNDMLVRSAEIQCGARAARSARTLCDREATARSATRRS